MCGLVGFAASGERCSDRLALAMAALQHRGPDGQGESLRGHVALGHTRLSIIDLEGGAQPLLSTCGRYVLVANGEIYNHTELRQALLNEGARFQTRSDCEVILQGYVVWGREILNRIEGMYAFALHDIERDEVLLARDPLGMKPLYWCQSGEGVRFASELKALLALMPTTPDLNSTAIVQYIEAQHPLSRNTPFHGVERLLAGEALLIRHGRRAEQWRHWCANDVSHTSSADPIADLDGLMQTVFTQHQRADVPIGLFLSGGVDSTILLGLMRRYGMEDIHTFSLGFPDSSVGDELDVATRLARYFGTDHRILTPTADDMLTRLPQVVWAADDLMRDPASLPTLLLAEEASRSMKVVFSGEGGDEAFAGYGRYRTGAIERFLKGMLFPGTGGFRSRGDLRGGVAKQLLGSELLAARGRWREALKESWQSRPADWTPLQKMQALDLEHALPDNLLVKADRMLMAHGVEGRMPFVDRRLVCWGLSLPDELKQDRREGKKILKSWASTFMPAEHFAAKKRGFYVPVNDWWQGDRLVALSRVLSNNVAIREWFQPAGVQRLLADQGRTQRSGRQLMTLLQFALWHHFFVQSSTSALPEVSDPLGLLSA